MSEQKITKQDVGYLVRRAKRLERQCLDMDEDTALIALRRAADDRKRAELLRRQLESNANL